MTTIASPAGGSGGVAGSASSAATRAARRPRPGAGQLAGHPRDAGQRAHQELRQADGGDERADAQLAVERELAADPRDEREERADDERRDAVERRVRAGRAQGGRSAAPLAAV